jgi:tetratricopeptide repeat protein/fibronectin type III domain protein
MSASGHLAAIHQRAHELRARGDAAGALELILQSIDAASFTMGADHPDVLATFGLIANLQRELGDLPSARRILEEAIADGQHSPGPHHPVMLQLAADLGIVADELGNRHEARRNFTLVAQAGPTALGADHPSVLVARRYLAEYGAATTGAPALPRALSPVPAPEFPKIAPGGPAFRDEPGGDPLDEPTRLDIGAPSADTRAFAPAEPITVPFAQPAPPSPVDPAPDEGPIFVPAADTPGVYVPARQQALEVRATQSDRLPAITRQPPWRPERTTRAPARSHRTLTAIGVLLGVTLLAAATLTVVAYLRASPAPQTPAAAASSPAASPGEPGAPASLSLRDTGGSVTLTWADPAGGRTSFVVLGGRSTELPRAFVTLPGGQTTYTVNGLNPQADYCFRVAAVYATDRLAMSAPVCTARQHPSASARPGSGSAHPSTSAP